MYATYSYRRQDGVPVLHRYLRKLAAHDCLCDGWID